MAIQTSIGKWNIRPPVESQPIKISFWNLAHVITSGTSPRSQFFFGGGQIGSAGIFPKYVKDNTFVILWLSLFFSLFIPQVKPRLWRTRLIAKTTQKGAFWQLEWRVTAFGEIRPQSPLNMGVNKQFQAKTPKLKNSNISVD